MPRRSNFATFVAKLRKVEGKTKEFILFFADGAPICYKLLKGYGVC